MKGKDKMKKMEIKWLCQDLMRFYNEQVCSQCKVSAEQMEEFYETISRLEIMLEEAEGRRRSRCH